jgi:hypothetical protein
MPGDPRFQDPARFPCAVDGCGRRAAGWIGSELAEDRHRREADRVYLCVQHGPQWWSASDRGDGGAAR